MSQNKKFKAIFLVGPTASGKTYFAHKLAKQFHLDIISMDSMQVYKGMDIGTSKPSKIEIEKCKSEGIDYYGIDIVSPENHFSTGDYKRYTNSIIEKIYMNGKIPFFVGGTGLYFDALTKGLDEIPPKNDKLRKELEEVASKKGLDFLYQELKKIDKIYTSKISPSDKKRIIRALEVYKITGKPFSSFHKSEIFKYSDKTNKKREIITINFLQELNSEKIHNLLDKKKFLKIGILINRDNLYKRINKRVDQMLENGFLEEVIYLLKTIGYKDTPAFKAIGYSHLIKFIKDTDILTKVDKVEKSSILNKLYAMGLKNKLQETIDTIKRDTRRYAKRQYTWFKHDPEIIWVKAENKDFFLKIVSILIEKFINSHNTNN